jgi:hypothetical protein
MPLAINSKKLYLGKFFISFRNTGAGSHYATFINFILSSMKNLMQHFLTLIAFFILETIVSSCKKDKNSTVCFPGAATVRQITNKQAVIKVTATIYNVYLIEQGSIDTKLIPCSIPMEFYQNDLQVVISGDVKSTQQGGPAPCCYEDFVITKISR